MKCEKKKSLKVFLFLEVVQKNMPEEKKCFYVEIYELFEQIPCKSLEEARKTMEYEEGLGYRNIPVKLDIAEGTEADYEAHFGEEKERMEASK